MPPGATGRHLNVCTRLLMEKPPNDDLLSYKVVSYLSHASSQIWQIFQIIKYWGALSAAEAV